MPEISLWGTFPKEDREILEPVFKKWTSLIETYIRDYRKHDFREWDAPYWYNERATLSLLAAAAWKTPGHLALEEYISAEKRAQPKHNRKRKMPGRIDLWIHSRKRSYVAEAAQDEVCISTGPEKPRVWTTEVVCNATMGVAVHEAHRCPTSEGKRLAIAFIVPYFPEYDRTTFRQRVEEFEVGIERFKYRGGNKAPLSVSQYKKDTRGGIGKIGWLYKSSVEKIPSYEWQQPGGPHYYPGVVALIQRVK